MLGSPNSEQYRTRVGLVILAVGFLLLFWAWGSWFYRNWVPVHAQAEALAHRNVLPVAETDQEIGVRGAKATRTLSLYLMMALAMVLVFLFGGYLLMRVTRRYRAAIDRKRPPHRIPVTCGRCTSFRQSSMTRNILSPDAEAC